MKKINFDIKNIRLYACFLYDKLLCSFSKFKKHSYDFLSYSKLQICRNKNSIIKILIPLVIILLGYNSCSMSKKTIISNINEIFEISNEVRYKFADQPCYWGLDTKFAIDNKIIPQKFIHEGKIVLSSGTEIYIGQGQSADPVFPLSQNFDIIIRGLSKAQCISYAEVELSSENLLKLDAIHIINQNNEYIFSWGTEYTLPVAKNIVKKLCSDDNIIIWSMK